MARQEEWSCTFNLSASSACCFIHSMKRLGSARYCFLSDATCFLSFMRAASDQGSLPHTRSQNTNINEKRSSLGHWSSPMHAWEDYTVLCRLDYTVLYRVNYTVSCRMDCTMSYWVEYEEHIVRYHAVLHIAERVQALLYRHDTTIALYV
jgi:hypothetical protein